MQENKINLCDYRYDLPEELIAQSPMEKRDNSRLMLLDRKSGITEHKHFYDIIDCLKSGDVLVINKTKVIPARLYGERTDTKSTVEFVLLERKSGDIWETLVRPGKKAQPGHSFSFGGGLFTGVIEAVCEGGNRLIKFSYNGEFYSLLDRAGSMPLPPYIRERLQDGNRYQTVYAEEKGSAAAPTAGLHFTDELLEKIREKGVVIAPLILHVGLGTFRPVKTDNILEHKMHEEQYHISEETADAVNNAKKDGRRIIAVGTTSCRALEAASQNDGTVKSGTDRTNIFIYEGYSFKTINALITNFHLPESTLIMLVSAFSTRKNIMAAYKTAVDEKYRFFSFGDAMFIS